MLSYAQQQNHTEAKDSIPLAAAFGLKYAIAPDMNLLPKEHIELPFFCALEKKIAITIKSDVKLGIEPCNPLPRYNAVSPTVVPALSRPNQSVPPAID